MKTEIVKLSQIRTNSANPRTISQQKFDKLVNSILVFPKMLEIRTIVVDATMVDLGGNMRHRALTAIADMTAGDIRCRLSTLRDYQSKSDGEQQALLDYWAQWIDNPTACITKADELSDAEKRAFVIKDNVGYGEWDMDALANEWDGEDLLEWGLDVWADSSTNDGGDSSADEHPNEEDGSIEVRCKIGDVWQLGDHRLMCGDSVNLDDVKKLMGAMTDEIQNNVKE